MGKGRVCNTVLLICCSVWHPMSCTARGSHSFTITHMQVHNSTEECPCIKINNEIKKGDKKKKKMYYLLRDRGSEECVANYLLDFNNRSLPFSHILLVSEPSSWKKMILFCTMLALHTENKMKGR